jgi:hypothetical protein
MQIIDLFIRFYDSLTAKSSSIIAIGLGITNVLWIFFFDRFSSGLLVKNMPMKTWLILANITLYLLIFLLLTSVLFGVMSIKKGLKGFLGIPSSKRWIIIAIIGILLGVLPLIFCELTGRIWFKILYF